MNRLDLLASVCRLSYAIRITLATPTMTTPKADVTVLDLDSPEGKALAERLRRGMEEAKAQVRNHGGTSYEDFYIDENGKPRSLAEDD